MISLSTIFNIIILFVFLFITGALFYGVMERIGNYIDFVGLFVKLYHKLWSLLHKHTHPTSQHKKQE